MAPTSGKVTFTAQEALQFHHQGKPGKLEVAPTKPMATQHDLALAYTPGVAAACEAIAADPSLAAELTGRANLVAVVSNGTAVPLLTPATRRARPPPGARTHGPSTSKAARGS